jgi:hypothetical protein
LSAGLQPVRSIGPERRGAGPAPAVP